MNQILLVEGKDDKMVFASIFKKHHIKETFEIIDKNGFNEIIKGLPLYLKTDNQTIGIVVDADTNIENRWASLKSILTSTGYSIPDQLSTKGTIIYDDDLPTIGIWIMPNNKDVGMLEDFIEYLTPADDKLMPVVDSTLLDLEAQNLNKYKPIHKTKAKIHTWLAWQKTPGTPMGLAITKTYLDTNQELCKEFVAWVNRLYIINAPE